MKRVSIAVGRKIEIGIICVSLVLQCYYMVKKYPVTKQCMYAQNEQLIAEESKLQQLNNGLTKLPELKQQLEIVEAKVAAFEKKFPEGETTATQMHVLKKYMHINGFYNTKLTDEGQDVCETEVGRIVKQYYTLEFTSFYDEAKAFIAHLNSAREMITLQNVTMTNQVQEIEDEKVIHALKARFGQDLSQVVTTQITLTIYTREEEKGQEEERSLEENSVIYSENPFKTTSNYEVDNMVEESSNGLSHSDTNEVVQRDIFEIILADLFTSGETYKISGPGVKGVSVGLISEENIYMTLKIDAQGYAISVEDEKGNIKQNSYAMSLKSPAVYIESTMKQIQAKIPQINIYIYNDLEEEIEVQLGGSLLENVHIYNKFEEELAGGEVKGNVRRIG